MEIFVNDSCIQVFEGARAIDAIRVYCKMLNCPVPEPYPVILDYYGNIIEPDGALTMRNRIFISELLNTQTDE